MSGGGALVDGYDAALFDLDGVVYLGPVAVPGAVGGIAELRRRGCTVGFVTNNAARSPRVVAEHLVELGIEAGSTDVVTSAQAAAHVLLSRFGRGARILAVGGEGVLDALTEAGLEAVHSADDDPVGVIQGFGFALAWQELNEAAIAINRGAYWVATNDDPTRPTDRGLVPGNGAAVAAVGFAVSVAPEVAGKPYRPLLDDTVARLGAAHPIFVGDRLDTDIAGARNAGLDSLLVLSGSHGPADLLGAPAGSRPTHLGQDLTALLQPARTAWSDGDSWTVDGLTARHDDGQLQLHGTSDDLLAPLWATAHLCWSAADRGTPLDLPGALAALALPAG